VHIVRAIIAIKRVLYDAFGHFNYDDGWAMASHLALSSLLALFPFLIFATSLASFLGAQAFADTIVHLVFDTWPADIAEPIAREVTEVLTVQRGDFLTIGILVTAFFATNGIEALRVSLNRAYRVTETRSMWWLRLQGLAFVVIATIGFVIVSTLLVFLPIAVNFAVEHLPQIEPYVGTITIWRYIVASIVIVVGLAAAHYWLPDGHRKLIHLVPGMIFTLVFWVLGSTAFAYYLQEYALYASYYAGLASIMIALVFLYIVSVIFIMGAELNAAMRRYFDARARVMRRPVPG
jgi:membrane protein